MATRRVKQCRNVCCCRQNTSYDSFFYLEIQVTHCARLHFRVAPVFWTQSPISPPAPASPYLSAPCTGPQPAALHLFTCGISSTQLSVQRLDSQQNCRSPMSSVTAWEGKKNKTHKATSKIIHCSLMFVHLCRRLSSDSRGCLAECRLRTSRSRTVQTCSDA